MKSFVGPAVLLGLFAGWAQAQVVVARLPASGTYHGDLDAGGEAIAVQGVPGEISVIRLRGHGTKLPELGQMVEGWSLTLLQANQPTRTWSGGPHARLESDPVQFGLDGVIVAVVQTTQEPGVTPPYVLHASSHLSKSFLHPDVHSASPLPGGGFPAQQVETWLRPGLELRVRMSFHPPKLLTQDGDVPPQLVATPPYLGGDPWTEEFESPSFPFPKSWIDSFEPPTVVHASYKAEPTWFNTMTARVRRRKVVVGAPKSSPVPVNVIAVHTDSLEVPAGGHVEVMAQVKSSCPDALSQQTARVLLASLDALDVETGFDLTGPVDLELAPGFNPVSIGVDLPAEVTPGLYRLLLIVGTPGVFDACEAPYLGAFPLALRVLEP